MNKINKKEKELIENHVQYVHITYSSMMWRLFLYVATIQNMQILHNGNSINSIQIKSNSNQNQFIVQVSYM